MAAAKPLLALFCFDASPGAGLLGAAKPLLALFRFDASPGAGLLGAAKPLLALFRFDASSLAGLLQLFSLPVVLAAKVIGVEPSRFA